MTHPKTNNRNDYRKNHGVPGIIYILDNPGLRKGVFKIGCTRRSGDIRARQLNIDANTGTPGTFRCIFECRTDDCGKAEESVFQKIAEHRRGKWGQEYFEVELDHAKEIIVQICEEVDRENKKIFQTQNTRISDYVNTELDSPQIPISNESSALLHTSIGAVTRTTVPLDFAKQIHSTHETRKLWFLAGFLWSEMLNLLELGIVISIIVLFTKWLSS